MIGIFRQKNPGNTLLLLLYGLVIKFPVLLNPAPALRQSEDHYLYNVLMGFLGPSELSPLFFSLLAVALLFIQAFLLNRLMILQKLFPKPGFLPAMVYLLISSFVPEWNQFSAPLLVNTLLIWIYYRMALLYNTHTPNGEVFNIGLLLGIASLFYEPAIVFLLLVPLALFVMRPFRIREWFIAFMGATMPYYFLGVILFLTDRFTWQAILPAISLDLPDIPESIFITVAMVLLVLPFIAGGFYVQANLAKMLIQVRKNWSLMLLFMIISLLIILVSGGNRYVNWICCIIPLSAFHSALYYYTPGIWPARILHWLGVAFAIGINYYSFF